MDIARDICTDSFYIVNSGLPCIAVTAVIYESMCLENWISLGNSKRKCSKGKHTDKKNKPRQETALS